MSTLTAGLTLRRTSVMLSALSGTHLSPSLSILPLTPLRNFPSFLQLLRFNFIPQRRKRFHASSIRVRALRLKYLWGIPLLDHFQLGPLLTPSCHDESQPVEDRQAERQMTRGEGIVSGPTPQLLARCSRYPVRSHMRQGKPAPTNELMFPDTLLFS